MFYLKKLVILFVIGILSLGGIAYASSDREIKNPQALP
jgi:hypothetical protein